MADNFESCLNESENFHKRKAIIALTGIVNVISPFFLFSSFLSYLILSPQVFPMSKEQYDRLIDGSLSSSPFLPVLLLPFLFIAITPYTYEANKEKSDEEKKKNEDLFVIADSYKHALESQKSRMIVTSLFYFYFSKTLSPRDKNVFIIF